MTHPEPQSAPETREVPRLTAILLAVVALAWAAGMLISARAKITSWADAAMEVTSTAYALPGAVSAAIVAGAAVALLVITLLSTRRRLGATTRFAVGTATGLLVGVLCALVLFTINTEGTMYAAVGGTVAAAATIGGAFAGLRIPPVIAAAGWGALGVFLVGLILNDNFVQGPVLNLLGNDSTEAAADANQYFSYGQSVLSGLAAGLIAFVVLRRAGRRAGADLRWPFFLIAGGGAGLLTVISEVLTRTAGAQVLDLAGKVSELETSVQQILSTNRLNSALIVLFVGAFTAMVAVGRTLSPEGDEDQDGFEEAPAVSRAAAGDAPIEPKAPAEPAGEAPAAPRTPAKTAASSEDAEQA
jgi:DNA-binding transcriptional regulator of glucitol operon